MPNGVSSVGPEALLPSFAFQRWRGVGAAPTQPAWQSIDNGLPKTPGAAGAQAVGYEDTCPDAVFRNSVMQTGGALPYQPIFDIGCESFTAAGSKNRTAGVPEVKVVVLENEYLRAAVMPIGGKIWSLYDKKRKKELLYNPPALQPGINAYRPWGPGGMEWNWSPGVVGHIVSDNDASTRILVDPPSAQESAQRSNRSDHLSTDHTVARYQPALHSSPVFMAKLNTTRGEVLRVVLFSLFILKMIILPRHARDKHRASTQKRSVFAGPARW
jgi:hypothetical protein